MRRPSSGSATRGDGPVRGIFAPWSTAAEARRRVRGVATRSSKDTSARSMTCRPATGIRCGVSVGTAVLCGGPGRTGRGIPRAWPWPRPTRPCSVSECCRMERCWPEAHPAGSLRGRTPGWKSSAGIPAGPSWSRTNGVPERTVISDAGGPENPWDRFPAGSAACWTPGGGPASAFTMAMRPYWARRRHNPCTTEVSAR